MTVYTGRKKKFGSGATVGWMVAAWVCGVVGGGGNAAAANLSYGRQVIINRGLQIQSLGFVASTPVTPTNYSLWASGNFTTFNSWNDNNSEKTLGWTMPWSRWMKTDGSNPISNNEKTQHLSELVSLQYGDELNQDGTGTIDSETAATMAATYADWHSQYGTNFLAYSNFGANNASKSMTPAGLAAYMSATSPDMLMFDAYPLQYVTLATWYAEMQKYRLAGLAGNDGSGIQPIPYGQYLDLYRTTYGASLPDEAFVRLQEFASWAFGYTFVTAFVYNKPNNVTVYPALFSSDGDSQTTVVFNEVAEANRQSRNLGPALARMTSTDLRMIPGTGHALPAGISAWAQGAGGNNYLTSITPVQSPGGGNSASYNDVLVGYFEPLANIDTSLPFAQGKHFMLVNAASSGSAAGQAQWYHLTFDFGASGLNTLQLLSRDTGRVQYVPLTHVTGSQYSLDWNLPGGTGDLFRFATAPSATLWRPYFDASSRLVISGSNATDVAGETYSVLSSTNGAAPLSSWTTNSNGVFGAGGGFTSVITTNALETQRFFIIRSP